MDRDDEIADLGLLDIAAARPPIAFQPALAFDRLLFLCEHRDAVEPFCPCHTANHSRPLLISLHWQGFAWRPFSSWRQTIRLLLREIFSEQALHARALMPLTFRR